MATRGISSDTLERVYRKNYYHPVSAAVRQDRAQAEFVMKSSDYLNRLVTAKRVALAREKYRALYPLFADLEAKYGVGFHYLVAFWGVETNFGQTFGNFEVIDALTNLAFDKRRAAFFREELYQALKIIDAYGIDPEQMEGSWAGAMGHFQFMPSTFNAYAVDWDGDGRIDIWHSFEDAAASAANYLSSIGWDKGSAWGARVELPWDFDYEQTGLKKFKTVAEWRKAGVAADGADASAKASVIVPEGRRGPAYLVFGNFHIVMKWNRSENYALAVCLLADYIKDESRAFAPVAGSGGKLKRDDVSKIQRFLNRWFDSGLDEDGALGSKTKESIKALQKQAKIPADGYPSLHLLEKINRYDPDIGFTVPVPARRPARPVRKSK